MNGVNNNTMKLAGAVLFVAMPTVYGFMRFRNKAKYGNNENKTNILLAGLGGAAVGAIFGIVIYKTVVSKILDKVV